MPTISQLPTAAAVTAADAIPISQGGTTRSVSVGSLLAQSQPAIMLSSPSLLGRISLGPGGPEEIAIGQGLLLTSGTLAASGTTRGEIASVATLSATDYILISSGDTDVKVPASTIRTLFTAGADIFIDQTGVISCSGTVASVGNPQALSRLPTTQSAASSDILPISQNGTTYAISYSDLLNGLTIDRAQAASGASDSDSFWVNQGGNAMSRQTLLNLWNWIASKIPSTRLPVVELATNTVFDVTAHNGRILVCSATLTLSAATINMGSGFSCDVINLSNGNVVLSSEIGSSNGTGILAPGQSALVRCIVYSGGTKVHAMISGSLAANTVPGIVACLIASNVTSTGLTLSWTTPTSGATPTGYTLQLRPSGSTTWSVVAQNIAAQSFAVTGLSASTSYDLVVIASNGAGASAPSAVLTIATAATSSVPGQVGNVSVVAQSSTSILISWAAPTVGNPPFTYTVQYRVSGSATWSGSIPNVTTTSLTINGLIAATTYELAVIPSNSAGSGPLSAIATCATAHQAGAVTAITWNMPPSGSYTHGSGSIGMNVHVNPASAAVQFGFSTSSTTPPTTWTGALQVNTDLWGAYVSVPSTPGQYYAWAEGTDGSCQTVFSTPFTVT